MNPFTLKKIWQAVVGSLLVACVFVWTVSAQETAKSAPNEVSNKEKTALSRLHRNAVEIFVDRPGFGVRRLVLDLDDLLARPKSLGDADGPNRTGSEQPTPKAAAKPPHFAVKDLLLQWGSRIPTEDGKATWQVREVYLVGLVTHTDPVVYLTDRNPTKTGEKPKNRKDIPTRNLDAFEKTALIAVRGNEPLKAEKNGKNLRMFAPIFAGKRCAACHEQGTLLGAFTYELERVASTTELGEVSPQSR